jgi:CRP/FNR family cyclic AMP-dependent transcriptional regulator
MPHRLNLRAPADCQHCGWRPQHMFCNLAPEALADFNALGVSVALPKGAILFHEGDAGDRVHILCDGKVKLSCTSKDGKTLNLKIALAGDVLGLSGVISGSDFEVTAEALEPVSLKQIRRSEFIPFLERHGEASIHAAKALSDEYKSAYADARRLALSSSVTGRLAGLLLDWGRSASCGKAEMRFNMVLTHDDLANFTGSSRETITRALSRLQKDKVIAIHGASVHILLPERLAELAA